MYFDDILKLFKVGTAEEFEELLTQGLISNINMTNGRGESLLMIQCLNNCLRGVKLLIDHGADVNITDAQGNSALILACRHYKDDAKGECSEIIKLLASKGANIKSTPMFTSEIHGHRHGTALFEACISNRLDVVKLLLELGAATNDTHQNPLIESCELRRIDVVRLLIAHGADVNISDYGSRTSLGVACICGYDDIVELLLDNGADISPVINRDNETSMIIACICGHESTVKLLLDRGADVNYVGVRFTPLGAACQHGQFEVARLLFERGADVDISSMNGHTPLTVAAAAYQLNRDLVDLLLEYGADINAESGGYCALSMAAGLDRRESIILLLERGADLFKEDGVTPIAHTTSGLFTTDPEIVALVEKYSEINKRANRVIKPLLK